MNKKQTNHRRMFNTTQETMDENTALWNNIPVVVTVKNKFDELLQRIDEVNEKTNPASEAVTADKGNVLEGLAQKAVSLAGTLQAYAAITGKSKLSGEVKLTKTDIERARETDVEALIAPVINNVRKELENLAEYAVAEPMITELETSLDNFKALIGQPRTIRNQAFAAMTLLDELFDATNDLLKNKLNKLMIRFKFTHTKFYSEYERARTIVD